MVSASKIRKTQERQAASRPYAVKIRQVIGHLRLANPDYRHPFLHERPVKRVGMIIISSDRGLCGGLNINLSAPRSPRSRSTRSRASRWISAPSAARRCRSSAASAVR